MSDRFDRPIVRWAGSKRKLTATLAPYWARSGAKRYIEPFAGSASLFLHLAPQVSILGDINAELITAYTAIKTDLPSVLRVLSKWPNDNSVYYRVRSLDPHQLALNERAARFFYLNRFCFNGLYRTNKRGEFNVPYGGAKSGALPSRAVFQANSDALQCAELVTGDYTTTLEKARSGDFVYLDPPYFVSNRRVFNSYGPEEFDGDDVNRLAACLRGLDKKRVKFLLSYIESPQARFLANGFLTRRVDVDRHISSDLRSRKTVRELLISNFGP